MKKKLLISTIALGGLINETDAQIQKSGNKQLQDRLYYNLNNDSKVTALAKSNKVAAILAKSQYIDKFVDINGTGFFVIDTKDSTSAAQIIAELKSLGIDAKYDEVTPFATCPTPLFVFGDLWSNMGYINSASGATWTEKQNFDSIYPVIKQNFWNNLQDAGENVDLSLSEIPRLTHWDLPAFNLTKSFDYLRNSSIDGANSTVHGSGTAGPLGKTNNAGSPAGYDGGITGFFGVNPPKIQNVGDANFGYKSAQLAAMQAIINEANTSGRNQVMSISFLLTTGVDPDFDAMFAQADASGKVLFVIGAGNNSLPIGGTYAANHPSVLIVEASDGHGILASFSAYNAPLAFNGVTTRGISNLNDQAIVPFNGTSAATPNVASLAALYRSFYPSKVAGEIKSRFIDLKNTTTYIVNPSATISPSLRFGYLFQNDHFDIVHDYPGNVDIASNGGIIDLNASTHDIQGGTIANPTYWYQQNQTGPWVAIPGGILNKANLGVGTHSIKLEFDIAHNPGKCTQIVRGLKLTSTVTPIYLRDFSVLKQGNDAQVVWTSETEINGDRYEVERSIDGITFQKIGTVQAIGNSSTTQHYSYVDRSIGNQYAGQNVFYRLKMVDKDNSFRYSDIRVVKFDNKNSISVYPTPAKDIVNVLTTDINRIVMINMNGQILRDQAVQVTGGVTRTNIDVSKMPAGVYVLRLVGTDRTVRTEKVIVAK